jgi:hypothetical protein
MQDNAKQVGVREDWDEPWNFLRREEDGGADRSIYTPDQSWKSDVQPQTSQDLGETAEKSV